jgi:hypothetical protein
MRKIKMEVVERGGRPGDAVRLDGRRALVRYQVNRWGHRVV